MSLDSRFLFLPEELKKAKEIEGYLAKVGYDASTRTLTTCTGEKYSVGFRIENHVFPIVDRKTHNIYICRDGFYDGSLYSRLHRILVAIGRLNFEGSHNEEEFAERFSEQQLKEMKVGV